MLKDDSKRWMIWIILGVGVVGFYVLSYLNSNKKDNGPVVSPEVFATTTATLVPDWAPIEGPLSAKVTIVEFLDYQCPGCGAYHPVVSMMREEFKGKIKFVVRHFPLVELHQYSKGAAISAVCAQRQGKFFEYSDVLFLNQNNLRRADLEKYASEMAFNMDDFKACLDDKSAEAIVISDRKAGEALHIPGTPALFINGKLLKELSPPDDLRKIIQGELAK